MDYGYCISQPGAENPPKCLILYAKMRSEIWKTIYLFTNPYSIIPPSPTLSTYAEALTIGRMSVYIVLYTATVLVVQLFINSLAAYAFARVEFPGRDRLFLAVLATLMLPGSVTLIPTFLIAHALGLTDT